MIQQGPYSIDKFTKYIKTLEQRKRDYNKKFNKSIKILKWIPTVLLIGEIIFILITNSLNHINYKTIIGFFLFIFIYYLVFIFRYDLKYDKYYEKIWEYESEFEEKSTKVPLKNIINHIEVTGNKVVFPPLNEINNTYYYNNCLIWSYGNTNKRMIFELVGNHLWERYQLETEDGASYSIDYSEYELLVSKSKI